MFAKTVLTEEERVVDNQLGYPRGYGKLCRHAYIQMQGLITPYTEGPPQRFQPYSPLEEEMNKLKEFDELFPYVNEEERDPANARRHADFLWQQLDHLGNAGFDPAKFRIDMYGNVVYWNADPASPLAWEVDHWFPHSRGGKTVVGNLRIVQWQVNQRKGTKLEFLVPWWDLQIGISVNQFLCAFSSKNAEFRQRAFALFFQGGENEQLDDTLVVECHSWPRHFRERKHQVGPAAAAIVKVQKTMDDTLRVLNHNQTTLNTTKQTYQVVNNGSTIRRRWSSDEEEALRRAVQKVGPGNWKEIKELEPMLINRSTVQIKDKYRLMKGEWKVDKENKEGVTSLVASAIQKEEKVKMAQEEEKKQKEEELIRLEDELKLLRSHNDQEKSLLEELERILAKERKRVEKQRKWSETQSQYRICLDKMIRDTMHQCVVYKEQARLNQAACNALLARLESQKATCDAAEMDLMKRVKQRESLEASVRPKFIKRTRNVGHTDVGTCVKPTSLGKMRSQREWPCRAFDSPKPTQFHQSRIVAKEEISTEQSFDNTTTDLSKEEDSIDSFEKEDYSASNEVEDEENGEVDTLTSRGRGPNMDDHDRLIRYASHNDGKEKLVPASLNGNSGMKRKSLEMNDMEAFFFEDEEANGEEESTNDNGDFEVGLISEEGEDEALRFNGETPQQGKKVEEEVSVPRTQDDEQLDELLQEVLEMKGKVNAAMVEAIKDEEEEEEEEEEDRIKRMGKFNLDKWLKKLLLNPEAEEGADEEAEEEEGKEVEEPKEVEKGGGPMRLNVESVTNKAHIMPNVEIHAPNQARYAGVNADHNEFTMKKKNKIDGGKKKPEKSHNPLLSPWIRRPSINPTFKRAASNINAPPDSNNLSIRRKSSLTSSRGHSEMIKDLKIEELRVISSLAGLKLNKHDGDVQEDKEEEDEEECREVAFQIECEAEFVEKMRARRQREEWLKQQRIAGVHPSLQDLLGESSSQGPFNDQLRSNDHGSPSVASSSSSSPPRPRQSPLATQEEVAGPPKSGRRTLVDSNHVSSNDEKAGWKDRRHSMVVGGMEMRAMQDRKLIRLEEMIPDMAESRDRHHRHRSVSAAARSWRGRSSSPRRRGPVAGGTERSLSTPPGRAPPPIPPPPPPPAAFERKEGRLLGRQWSDRGGADGGAPARKVDKTMMVKRNNTSSGPGVVMVVERGRGRERRRRTGTGQKEGDKEEEEEEEEEKEKEVEEAVAAILTPSKKKSGSGILVHGEWGDPNASESGFRASLSNVWKKAVKKFDIARA